jgi:hypothetical protein
VVDPQVGFALAARRFWQRRWPRYRRALLGWTLTAAFVCIVVGAPITAGSQRCFDVPLSAAELVREAAVYAFLRWRNLSLSLQDALFLFQLPDSAMVATGPQWQNSAAEVLAWARSDVMVRALPFLQSMILPVWHLFACSPPAIKCACVAAVLGFTAATTYAEAKMTPSSTRRCMALVNGPLVPFLASLAAAGVSEFAASLFVYSSHLSVPLVRLVVYGGRSVLLATFPCIAAVLAYVDARLAYSTYRNEKTVAFAAVATFAVRHIDAWMPLSAVEWPLTALVPPLAMFYWDVIRGAEPCPCPISEVFRSPYRLSGTRETLFEHSLYDPYPPPSASRRRSRVHGVISNVAGLVTLAGTGDALRAAAAKVVVSMALAGLHHVGRHLGYRAISLT